MGNWGLQGELSEFKNRKQEISHTEHLQQWASLGRPAILKNESQIKHEKRTLTWHGSQTFYDHVLRKYRKVQEQLISFSQRNIVWFKWTTLIVDIEYASHSPAEGIYKVMMWGKGPSISSSGFSLHISTFHLFCALQYGRKKLCLLRFYSLSKLVI